MYCFAGTKLPMLHASDDRLAVNSAETLGVKQRESSKIESRRMRGYCLFGCINRGLICKGYQCARWF